MMGSTRRAFILPSPQLPRALFPSLHSPAYQKDEKDLLGGERNDLKMLFLSQRCFFALMALNK